MSSPSSTDPEDDASSLDEIIDTSTRQQQAGYADLFLDWKRAQGTIKSSLQQHSRSSEQPPRLQHNRYRPTRDSMDVIRGRSSVEQPSSSSNHRNRDYRRGTLTGEDRIQRAHRQAAAAAREMSAASALPEQPSAGRQHRQKQKQRQVILIAVLVLMALVATLAVAISPLILLRHHRAQTAASSQTTTANNRPDGSATTLVGNSSTTSDPEALDPRDPAGDLTAYPDLPLVPVTAPAPTLRPTLGFFTTRPTKAPTVTVATPRVEDNNDPMDMDALWAQVRSFVTVSDLHFQDPSSSYGKAWTFVAYVDLLVDAEDTENLQQRFAMALLNAAVGGPFADPLVHECDWVGVECSNAVVTSVAWPNYGLRGHLPQDIGLLSALTTLDLADNQLWGTIPESLYTGMHQLQHVFLHQNHLSGTLSNSIAQLTQLQRLVLASNFLSGTIPRGIGSPSTGGQNVRSLAYLSLYENHFTGTIPPNLNLRNLFYLDLGRNQLSGTFPDDWVEGRDNLRRLRLLYVDNNNLMGSLPPNLGTIGGGRLQSISVHSNQLTGMIPGFHNYTSFLNVAEFHHNQFTSMDQQGMCRQVVFNGGEMVMLRADCQACLCNFFCQEPLCY